MPNPPSTSKPLNFTSIVLLACALLIGLFLWQVQSMLAAFMMGLVIAYLLNPIVEKLEATKLGSLIKRSGAAFGMLTLFYLGLFTIIGLALPFLIKEGMSMVGAYSMEETQAATHISNLLTTVENVFGISLSFGMLAGWLANMGQSLLNGLFSSLGSLLMTGFALGDILALILITPLVAFYMLKEWQGIETFIAEMIPTRARPETLALLGRMDQKIAGFIRGQLMVCLTQGVVMGALLQISGLHFGFLFGMMIGLLSFIPVIGGMVGMGLTLVAALLQYGVSGWEPYAIICSIFLLGNVLESFVLSPKFLGDNVGLHPVWILFALMAGGQLASITGMLVAVPVAAVVSELLLLAIKTWKQSHWYQS